MKAKPVTVEITASHSGKLGNIPGDTYGNESPFFSAKEILEVPDDWSHKDRELYQAEMWLSAKELYDSAKEESLMKHLSPKGKPHTCMSEAFEEIRQIAIKEIIKQGKGNKESVKGLFVGMFNEPLESLDDLQRMGVQSARHFNRRLGVLINKQEN